MALRRTIYLTIQSSLDFEECAHKLIKMQLKPGQEARYTIYTYKHVYLYTDVNSYAAGISDSAGYEGLIGRHVPDGSVRALV